MNQNKELSCEFEYKNDLYRVYELDEDDSDYVRIVSESKKAMDIVRTKNVKNDSRIR